MKKITDFMGKIPLTVLFIITLINCFINGAVCALLNVKESLIVHGFTNSLFITLIIGYILVILTNMVDQFSTKAFKNKEMNNQCTKLLERVLNSKMPDIQEISSGKIFSVVKDLSGLYGNFKLSITWMVCAFMPFITLIIKEFTYKPITAIISLTSLPIAIYMSLMSEKLFKFSEKQEMKLSRLQGITSDNFQNIKTIKYLSVKTFAINRLKESQNEAWETNINPGQIFYFRIVELIGVFPLIINLWICKNNLEMVALLVISNWVLNNMRGNLINAAELIIEINSKKKIIESLKGDDTEKVLPFKDIELKNVFFDYGKDTIKFHIPYLHFKHGTKTLITGVSGAGKSSLANLLAGAIKPTTGVVDNIDCYYVWQETESLNDTLWNNIVFHNPYKVTEDEVLGYFEKLDMIEWFQNELPDGFNTLIGEKGCKLSSGQKQRINIIRTIIAIRNSPEKLFILDEITSNLDNNTKDLAIQLFKEYMNDDITAIIISHNDGFDQICDRKIKVEDHKFYEE